MPVPIAAPPAPIRPRSSLRRALAAPLVPLLVLALPAPAAAGPALSSRTNRPMHTLDADVLSADRIPTPKRRTGSSVTVITAEEIERKQYRDVVEALRAVPGVSVRQTGGPGRQASIFIRGTESDHALVLVDGIEVNDPSAPSRGAFFHHLTTDDVERIEVIRGPQSTVWGSDALGGVVNVITKRGERDLTVSGWAEGGSYATARGGFRAAGSRGPFVGSLAGSYVDRDGFSALDAGDEDDGYRNGTIAGRLGFAPSEHFDADVSVRHIDARTEFDNVGFPPPLFAPTLVEDGQHTKVQQTLVQATPAVHLGEGLFDSKLAFRYARTERNTQGLATSDNRGELFDLEWRNDLSAHGQTLSLGLESEWEQADFQADGFADSERTFSAYAQSQLRLGEWVFGTVGVRYDDHTRFGDEVTFRVAGGGHLPWTDTTLRASYGTGFKTPSLSDLAPEAAFGNPGLDPETSRGFDVGLEQGFLEEQVRVGATYFWNRIEDLIVPVPSAPGSFVFVNDNVDAATTRGVEAWFALEPGYGISISGSYTWLETEAEEDPATFGVASDGELLRRPEHGASLDVSVRPWDGPVVVSFFGLYVGERKDLDPVTFATVEADDYFWLGLRGSLDVTEWLRVFARVDNLIDEDYQDVFGFGTAGISGYGGIELRY